MKGAGMLVILLNHGCKFRILVSLRVQNAVIFSRKDLFEGCTGRNIKKIIYCQFFRLLHSCNQSLKWSPLGSKKKVGPRPDWSPFGV